MNVRFRCFGLLKKPVFLVLLMILGCLILLIAVRFVRTDIPQLYEMNIDSYYARMKAPGNGYLDLVEAFENLPKRPGRLQIDDPERPGATMPYKTSEDSIAFCFGVMRPDDDPELKTYIQALEPYFDACLEALEKPYCAITIIEGTDYIQSKNEVILNTLNNLWMARARYAFEIDHDTEAGLRYLTGLLQLTNFYQQDTLFKFPAIHTFRVIFHHAASLNATQLAQLAETLQGFEKASEEEYVQACWLSLDLRLHFFRQPNYTNPMRRLNAWREYRTLLNDARRVADNRERWVNDFKEMSQHSYGNYMEKNIWPKTTRRNQFYPEQIFHMLFWRYSFQESNHRKNMLFVALERYRKAHGAYPERLEALSPEYLEHIPLDAKSKKPYKYYLKDEGYVLYGVGRNLIDDGGAYTINEVGKMQHTYHEDIYIFPELSVTWY